MWKDIFIYLFFNLINTVYMIVKRNMYPLGIMLAQLLRVWGCMVKVNGLSPVLSSPDYLPDIH